MVAPVANVAPGVGGVVDFPVDAIARDAIRIVAIGGRGIEEDWRFITFAVKKSGDGSLRLSVGEDAKPTPSTR